MNMRCQKAIGGRSGVLTGPRGRRSGQITALLCLSVATALNSSSWTSSSPDVHTHTRTQMHTTPSTTSSARPPTPPACEPRNLSQIPSLSGQPASSSLPVCLFCCLRYQPIRLALAFSVSLRTRPFEEVPKVIDESSNSSCLCSSSESSSTYQADRRPWLRVRIDPPAPSPASSFGDSFRVDR